MDRRGTRLRGDAAAEVGQPFFFAFLHFFAAAPALFFDFLHFFAGAGGVAGVGAGPSVVCVTISVGPLPDSGTFGPPPPVINVPLRGPKAVGVKVTRTVQLRLTSCCPR